MLKDYCTRDYCEDDFQKPLHRGPSSLQLMKMQAGKLTRAEACPKMVERLEPQVPCPSVA
jgi:hypothetical protein